MLARSLLVALPLGTLASAQHYLQTWTGTTPAEELGTSVCGLGDVDGDGVPDVAAGSPGYDGGRGRVSVYSGGSGALLYTIDEPQAGSYLGVDVARAGDVDGDGVDDLLASAPFKGADGHVHLYSGADGSFVRGFYGPSGGGFGLRIAGGHDVDGDGVPDVAVLRSFDGAYVLSGATGAHLFEVGWDVEDVALVPDMNGDGRAEVVCGQPFEAPGGGVRVFSGADGAELLAVHGVGVDIGRAVDGAGDVNGDGVPDLVTSAWTTGAGEAFVHSGLDGAVLLHLVGDHASFGHRVAGLGDRDGDGVPDVAVTTLYAGGFVGGSGSATAYSGATGAPLAVCHGTQHLGRTGADVDAIGDVDGDGLADFILGSPGHDAGAGYDAGRVDLIGSANGGVVTVCADSGAQFGAMSCSTGKLDHGPVLRTTGLQGGQFSLFLVAAGSGSSVIPPGAQGSELCLDAPIGRYVLDLQAPSGPQDAVTLDLEATLTGGPGFGLPSPPGGVILAGATWHFQTWTRRGPGDARLSDGIAVTFH